MAARWVGNSRPLQMKKIPMDTFPAIRKQNFNFVCLCKAPTAWSWNPLDTYFYSPKNWTPDGVSDISKITQMSLQVFQAFFDVDGPSFTMIFHNSLFFFTHGLFSTGWWFGTFFYVPFHIWDVILPID